MLALAGLRWLVRRVTDDRADAAVDEVTKKLPAPVAGAVRKLPADVTRTGGRVLLAGKAAKSGVAVTGRAGATAGDAAAQGTRIAATGAAAGARLAARATRRGNDLQRRSRDGIADARADWERATDLEWRRHRADLARGDGDETAATEAWLDVRTSPDDAWTPPATPEPVDAGRRRHVPELPEPPVNRVQRTYQRPRKAWDRTRRPSS